MYHLPTPILLAALAVTPASAGPQKFGIEDTCRQAQTTIAGIGRTYENCLQDERAALAQLRKDWTGYPARMRADCERESTLGGLPSYVDLQQCIEMQVQLKKLGLQVK
jgi:hypothetical protein